MNRQLTLSDIDFLNKKKQTRKEIFLNKMSQFVPLDLLCEIIRPFYYVAGNGRRPTPLEIILKMYLVSNWYNLSDELTEDLLYDSLTVRHYVGVTDDVPDATTLGKFRVEIIEKNNLNKVIFDALNKMMEEQGIMLKEGTIVDATIINAPDSIKNKDKKPNPEMSVTCKNKNKFFGFKAHIGTDTQGLVHSVAVTTAKDSDVATAHEVLRGNEEAVYGDAAYTGVQNREEIREMFQDESGETEFVRIKKHNKVRKYEVPKLSAKVNFVVNKRRSQITTDEEKEIEREKSRKRIKVEHAFWTIKHIFGFRKTRQRTLDKNLNKLYLLFTLANVFRYAQRGLRLK